MLRVGVCVCVYVNYEKVLKLNFLFGNQIPT